MNDKPEKIEIVREVTESTDDHQYRDTQPIKLEVIRDRSISAILSLVLALPLPIMVIILWATLDAIKGSGQTFSNLTMNAVVLYLFQFFVVPVTSLISIILAIIVATNAKGRAAKIGYVSLGVSLVGIILLAVFLEQSK